MSANKGQQPPQGVPDPNAQGTGWQRDPGPQPYSGGDPNGGIIPPESNYDATPQADTAGGGGYQPWQSIQPQQPAPQQPVPLPGVGRGKAQMPMPAPPPPQMRPETTGTQDNYQQNAAIPRATVRPQFTPSGQPIPPEQQQDIPTQAPQQPEQGQKKATYGGTQGGSPAQRFNQATTEAQPQQQQAPPPPQEQQPQGHDRDFARRKLKRGMYG